MTRMEDTMSCFYYMLMGEAPGLFRSTVSNFNQELKTARVQIATALHILLLWIKPILLEFQPCDPGE